MRRLLYILGACASEPSASDQAAALSEALHLAAHDPDAAVEQCQVLAGSAASDCVNAVATTAARTDAPSAAALCRAHASNAWQGECMFAVAEVVAEVHDAEAGAAYCDEAGAFRKNCAGHLWRVHAEDLVTTRPLPHAATGFAATSTWLSGEPEPRVRRLMWTAFYDAVWLRTRTWALPIDPARCDELGDEDLVASCRLVLPEVLRQALVRAEDGAHDAWAPLDTTGLCDRAIPERDRVAQATHLSWVPDPDLDAVAERFATRACQRLASRRAGSRIGKIGWEEAPGTDNTTQPR